MGFGAKVPPFYNSASQCFAVNGDIFKPEEHGVKGLIEAYKKCIKEVEFHGPTAFAEVLRFAHRLVCFEPVT